MITVVAKLSKIVARAHINASIVAKNSCRLDRGLQTFVVQNVFEVEAPPAKPMNKHTPEAVNANKLANRDVILA
jgi:hypothetical protein